MRSRDAEDAFFSKVQKDGDCWVWMGAPRNRERSPYGTFYFDGWEYRAHVWAWELFFGPFPVGLEPDHLCRNTMCVKPWHIEPVPKRVNILRGNGMGARNAQKTHCLRGHEFTPENTRPQQDGKGRVCKTCAVDRATAHKQKKREAERATVAAPSSL